MSLLEKSQENILLYINILSLHGNIWGDFYFNPCSFSSNVLYIKKTFFLLFIIIQVNILAKIIFLFSL